MAGVTAGVDVEFHVCCAHKAPLWASGRIPPTGTASLRRHLTPTPLQQCINQSINQSINLAIYMCEDPFAGVLDIAMPQDGVHLPGCLRTEMAVGVILLD